MKRKKQKLVKPTVNIAGLLLSVGMGGVLFCLLLWFLTDYKGFLLENRDYFSFFIQIAGLVVLVYLSFFSAKRPPKIGRLFPPLSIVVGYAWLVTGSVRMNVLLEMIIFFVLLGWFVYYYLAQDKTYPAVYWALIISSFSVLNAGSIYTYLHDSKGIHFLDIHILLCLVGGVLGFVLLQADIIRLKDNRKSERALVPVLVAGVVFMISFSVVNNLNYALDTSDAVSYQTSITDKYTNSGYRSQTSYYLKVAYRGEPLDMCVSQLVYDEYEIGYNIDLAIYEGFFQDPYLLKEQ